MVIAVVGGSTALCLVKLEMVFGDCQVNPIATAASRA
jgi:hypothetical protein